MNASQLLAIGVLACASGFVASGNPPASTGAFQKEKIDSSEERGPMPCLIGTQKCSAQNNLPVKACLVGARSTGSCPVDGFKITQAGLR
jgi:hypothetical protein